MVNPKRILGRAFLVASIVYLPLLFTLILLPGLRVASQVTP